MYRILLIDEDQRNREGACAALSAAGHQVVALEPSDALELFDTTEFDVVMAGVAPTPQPVLRPVPQKLVYLSRPFSPADAVSAVSSLSQADPDRERLEPELPLGAPLIIGRSPAIVRALSRVEAVAQSDAPVLLTGESGTGKDLVARTIHALSARRDKPFVAINCAAFPDTLLEAELFGYERGAFTGALQRRDGRFRAADGGTLFLDEVNGLSLAAQAKLLRVLQDGSFQPIGTNATLTANVRLICATNRDLRELIAVRAFREDLYYRVKVLDIEVPALRDRVGDVPLLVQHFLAKHASEGSTTGLSPRAWAALTQHPFPGNVRELEHAIQHAIVLARSGEVDLEHLPSDLVPLRDAAGAEALGLEGGERPLSVAIHEFEREYVLRALQAAGGNKTRAARALGISRKNLWEKLTKRATPPEPIEPSPEDGYKH